MVPSKLTAVDATAAPKYLTSPEAALERAEKLEEQLLAASDNALAEFLGRVIDDAADGSLTRGSVRGYWRASVERVLAHPVFVDLRDGLLDSLADASFADDALTAAELALSTAHNLGATVEERKELLASLFAHPEPKEDGGLIASISDKVDGWLRRKVSKQLLARIGAVGRNALGDPIFPEYPVAPHASGTLVTEEDWASDDRPGDINWRARMQRDIRTGYTKVYGRQVQRQLEKYGFAEKKWVSRHDEHVRHTHAVANGQTVPLHSTFSVGGENLRFPGDPTATPGEVINCRCIAVGVDRAS